MEYEVEEGILIDETEGLLEMINKYSTFEVQSLDTVFRFIREEYHTKFYVDRKLTLSMAEEKYTTYLWLDTGIRTAQDEPVFISLLKKAAGYEGHYVGTVDVLSNVVRDFSPWYTNQINGNKKKVKRKYQSRTAKRENPCIRSEDKYIAKKMQTEKACIKVEDAEVTVASVCVEPVEEPKIIEFPKAIYQEITGTKIILDLEFTPVDETQQEMKQAAKFEIIQLGAVKLNHNNEIIGKYDSFVKPRYSKRIDPKVVNLTGITDDMIREAPDFIAVMNGFLGWAGENLTILSWSMDDYRVLKKESKQKDLIDERLDRLFENWYDLQKMFGDALGIDRQIALEHAVVGLDMVFEGNQHTALDDAINTANVFRIMQQEDIKSRYKNIVELFAQTDELTFSIGSMFGDLLKQIVEA